MSEIHEVSTLKVYLLKNGLARNVPRTQILSFLSQPLSRTCSVAEVLFVCVFLCTSWFNGFYSRNNVKNFVVRAKRGWVVAWRRIVRLLFFCYWWPNSLRVAKSSLAFLGWYERFMTLVIGGRFIACRKCFGSQSPKPEHASFQVLRFCSCSVCRGNFCVYLCDRTQPEVYFTPSFLECLFNFIYSMTY